MSEYRYGTIAVQKRLLYVSAYDAALPYCYIITSWSTNV
jgi:hypothetical protein